MPLAAVLRSARERRHHRRTPTKLDACINSGGWLIACVITDVSAGGAQLLAEVPADLDIVRLEIEAFGSFDCRIAWRTDTRVGVEFLTDAAELSRRLRTLLDS